MIYFVCFFISTLIFFVAQKQKHKKIRVALYMLAMLFPCLLAGLRDLSIGTDVKIYVEYLFLAAKNSKSYSDFYNASWVYAWDPIHTFDIEIGFSTFVYIVTKLTNSIGVLLFLLELVILIPVFNTLRILSKKNKISMCLGMLFFYLMFYSYSFNIIRQMLAVVLVFNATYYLQEKKYLTTFLLSLLAFSFHYTAILCIPIYIFNILLVNNTHKITKQEAFKNRTIVFLTLSFIILSLIFIEYYIIFLEVIGFSKYIMYIDGRISFLPMQVINRLPIVILLVFNWKNFKSKNNDSYFLLLIFFLDFAVSQLTSINSFSSRITLYFGIFKITLFIKLIISTNFQEKKYLYATFLTMYSVFYFVYYFIIEGYNEIFPYIFSF